MKTALATLLLAALVGFSSPAVAAPPDEKPEPKDPLKKDRTPVVVPFEILKSRHMAVRVKINGKGPYRVVFDTGAPLNLINNKIAKDAGVLGKEDKPGPLFGAAIAPKKMKTFEVGGVSVEDMPTMVVDHPLVELLAKEVGELEGIVGFPFFARYKMTIDYEKKEITLVPNDYAPADTFQNMMQKVLNAAGKKPDAAVLAPAGVWGFTVDKKEGDEDEGVTVTGVLAKSPAEAGGLKKGDRLLTLGGRWTDSVGDTFHAAGVAKPGKPVPLVVKRDGKEVELTVTPGKGL